ncbi:MAG: pyridoxamine 5'-phosphate oxidase family protein [Proteobacteria bacterium]|nr:pyridoxamine 5'-phosphate oxidase family protein [Pseudomonadota bacterium]
MRRKEKQITDPAVIDQIIRQSKVCRLAMVDGDKPYVVPLSFGYDGTHLYFHSALEGRKMAVLRQNPHVCFEFDQVIKLVKNKEACEWGMAFKSVIGEGRAFLVADIAEKIKGLGVIMAQYSRRVFAFPGENLQKTALIKVEITRITGKQSG